MKEIAAFILLLGLAVGNSPAEAAPLPYAISPEEIRSLPPYCVARIKIPQDSPEAKTWRGRIGENFVDFFHYCAGLNFINRYWGTRNANERSSYLQQAKGEFDYIERAIKPDFTMSAELYANRGEVSSLMGKVGDAIGDLNKALSIDPKIAKPYLLLIDMHEKTKDRTRALAVATEGLRHLPDSKALQRHYLELGGKLPYPEPVHGAPVAAVQAVAPPPKITEEPTTSEKATNETPVSAPVLVPAKPIAQPKIGTPKNPYCRFCPD